MCTVSHLMVSRTSIKIEVFVFDFKEAMKPLTPYPAGDFLVWDYFFFFSVKICFTIYNF